MSLQKSNNSMVDEYNKQICYMEKETYLLVKMIMKFARHHGGDLFGGCVSTYFRKKHFITKYKNYLIAKNQLCNFDKHFANPDFDTATFDERNKTFRDIDIFFGTTSCVQNFKDKILKIPGVFQIKSCSTLSSYKRHALFSRFFQLEKIIVKYIYGNSISEKKSGTMIFINVDIVTKLPKFDKLDIHPLNFMQELTIKQLVWNDNVIQTFTESIPMERCYRSSLIRKSFDIIDNFNQNVCYITKETNFMRNSFKEFIYSSSEYNYSIKERLKECIQSRILVICRLLNYHKRYTIVNSPLVHADSLSKSMYNECGICFSDTKLVSKQSGPGKQSVNIDSFFRWKTKQNNTTYYCHECICNWMNELLKICNNYNVRDKRNRYLFHNNPILSPDTWNYLNDKQIYFIENIFVCPVGNKADFSGNVYF